MKKTMLTMMLSASCLLGSLASGTAYAHAHLVTMAPAQDSQLSVSPNALDLHFSEGIEPALSHITLKDAQHKEIKLSKLTLVAQDKTHAQVIIPSKLAPGHYEVEWRVVSVDSHKSSGKWQFVVTEEAK